MPALPPRRRDVAPAPSREGAGVDPALDSDSATAPESEPVSEPGTAADDSVRPDDEQDDWVPA